MRVLAAMVVFFGVGCSSLLGLEDPKPDFGGDGGPKSLVSISIDPSPLELPLGVSLQLRAIGQFDDGSSDDLTSQTAFAVADGSAIEVTAEGLATAVAEGQAKVTAALGRVVGETAARGLPAIADRLMFSIGDFEIAQRQSVRLHAIAVLTDGTTQDATANAMYASSAEAVAKVNTPGQVDAGSTAGEATISVTIGAATAGTVKATVTAAQCHPVINEFQAGGATGADEWVEILNPCTMAVDVTGWTLVYRAATTTGTIDTALMMALTGTMAPYETRLYAGVGYGGNSNGTWPDASGIMQQNNGGIAIRGGAMNVGTIIDSVAYGAVSAAHPFIEGNPLGAMANSRSAQRLPFDGRDSGDGAADFMLLTTTTPGAPNAP